MSVFPVRRRTLCCLAVAATWVFGVATASAGTASYSADGTSFTFTAGPGEANAVEVRSDGAAILVRDTGASISPGQGCVLSRPDEVRCTPIVAQCGLTDCYARIDLGDGDDRVTVAQRLLGSTAVLGGPGRDRLEGIRGPLIFDGGPGDDVILGSDGDDLLVGGDGADSMQGRVGVDTTSYADREGGVSVSLDGRPNDGAPGEGDDVRTEGVYGGNGDDRITGNDVANQFLPGLGQDVVDGGGGNDVIVVRPLFEKPDGPDSVRCGAGDDRVEAERADDPAFDCELVGLGGEAYRAVVIDPLRVRATKAGRVTLVLRRAAPPSTVSGLEGPLHGDVVLTASFGAVRSTQAGYALGADDDTIRATVRLDPATRRRLSRSRSRRITLVGTRRVRAGTEGASAGREIRITGLVTVLAPR